MAMRLHSIAVIWCNFLLEVAINTHSVEVRLYSDGLHDHLKLNLLRTKRVEKRTHRLQYNIKRATFNDNFQQ
eukprot:5935886-Amphidinium_carterae.1